MSMFMSSTYFYLWLCRDYDMYVIRSICIDFYLWSCRHYDMYVICRICIYFYLCLCQDDDMNVMSYLGSQAD